MHVVNFIFLKQVLKYKQIKDNMIVGDYQVASKILNTSSDNVRQRVLRKKQDVLEVLEAIIKNRNDFLKKMGVDT